MYQTIKETPNSNTIVRELNAAVCVATFTERGQVQADLYHSVNSANVLVAHGSCAPIHDTFVRTVTIILN